MVNSTAQEAGGGDDASQESCGMGVKPSAGDGSRDPAFSS
jgi:hypothetical protein